MASTSKSEPETVHSRGAGAPFDSVEANARCLSGANRSTDGEMGLLLLSQLRGRRASGSDARYPIPTVDAQSSSSILQLRGHYSSQFTGSKDWCILWQGMAVLDHIVVVI